MKNSDYGDNRLFIATVDMGERILAGSRPQARH